MEHALVAVYDDQDQAQQAFNALLEGGFSRDNIRLGSAESLGMIVPTDAKQDNGEPFSRKLANFFGFRERDETTELYSEAVRRGSCVLSVDVTSDDEAERAQHIVAQYFPMDIDERAAQWRESGWVPGNVENTNGETTIPVIKEELRVGKRVVQRGGVRIVSRISETPVEETIELREQHATVERKAVNREVTDADMAAFKEGSFEIREIAEEPVIAKTARVVEEVVVDTEVTEHTETISDSVRRTDVDVDDVDGEEGKTATTRKSEKPSSR